MKKQPTTTTDFREKIIETYELVHIMEITPPQARKRLNAIISELVEACIGKKKRHSPHDFGPSAFYLEGYNMALDELRQRFKEALK